MVEFEQIFIGVLLLVLVAIGVHLISQALKSLQRGWAIWQSDPVGASEVQYEDGAVEVQGTVEQLEAELLTTEYTDTPAVGYDYQHKVESDKGGEDNERWETVESGTEMQPFYVTDETGSIAVDPDGATISLDSEQISRNSTIELGPVDASTGKRYEGRLVPDDHVHVYGQKRTAQGDGPGGEQFYIGDGEQTDIFSIADTTEFRTSVRHLGQGIVGLLIGLAALGVAGVGSLILLGQLELTDLGLQLVIQLLEPTL